MEFEVFYWHWIVLGIALLVLEMALPSFTSLWFGTGAFIVGVLMLLIPGLSVELQVLIWTIASIVMTFSWFKFLKPLSSDRTTAGMSREAVLGQVGHVVKPAIESANGIVRFPAPLLGSDEWEFRTEDSHKEGDRVSVIDVAGNTLVVKKTS